MSIKESHTTCSCQSEDTEWVVLFSAIEGLGGDKFSTTILKSLLSEVSYKRSSRGASLRGRYKQQCWRFRTYTVMSDDDSIRSVLLPWLEVNDAWPTYYRRYRLLASVHQ